MPRFIRWKIGSFIRENDPGYYQVSSDFHQGIIDTKQKRYQDISAYLKEEYSQNKETYSGCILPMVRRIYPGLALGAKMFDDSYENMTQKDMTNATISTCTNSTANCQTSDCIASNDISYAELSNCSQSITPNMYTKKEVDDKMSEVYKTFEKELEIATVKIQLKDTENTHSVKANIYEVEEKVTKISEAVSWMQIQHYITWLMLAIIGLMIFFKSFDVSINVNNPIENQQIILEKTNE